MEPTEEYTGPPIGNPPEHVHDNAPVVDAIDDVADDAQELVDEIRSLETITKTQHTELLERLNICQTQLQTISERSQETESPMLTQIVAQLSQIQSELLEAKAELKALKESTAMRQPNPAPSELIVENPDEPSQETLIVEPSASNVENPPEPKQPKRNWV